MFTIEDLRFDPEAHRSWRPDGVEVPHVTAVLEAVGVSTDFAELAQSSRRMAQRIEEAAARGTAVHADCHAYDDDDLDWASVDQRVLPYVEAWATFREATGLTPLVHARERRLYHPTFNYAGIMDGLFLTPTHRKVLADIKTGDPESAAAHLQTAAYEAAWLAEDHEREVHERWAVWLRPGRVVPYSIINYTARPEAWTDFTKFQCCLTVYAEQPARRRRIT